MNTIRRDAKNVKAAFVKSKFIDAAKQIILRAGVEKVTVRGIAAITGFSYPMVYHYFRDLNELLLETKLEMIGDMVAADDDNMIQSDNPLECKKRQARRIVGFFMDNPKIFAFFYQYKLDDNNATRMRSLDLEKAYYSDFAPFVEREVIHQEDIPAISRAITFLVFGAVTIYLSNNGLTKDEALETVDNTIELLLKGKGSNGKK